MCKANFYFHVHVISVFRYKCIVQLHTLFGMCGKTAESAPARPDNYTLYN